MPAPVSPTPHRPDSPDDPDSHDDGDPDDRDPDDGDLDDEPRPRAGGWDRDLLVGRYGQGRTDELLALVEGRPAPHRRISVVSAVIAVLVAIGMTYAVWAYRSATTGTVGATFIGIQTDSDTSVLVTWTVSRDPGTTVACDISATDAAGAEVGLREQVVIAPGTDRATQLVTQVTTTRRGLNATVDRCQRIVPTQIVTPSPAG